MPGPEPETVAEALRYWCSVETHNLFGESLTEKLMNADHLAMWEKIATEYPDWGQPLLWLAQRVLCLPASEAHSERTAGKVRRVLGRFGARTGDETLFFRVQMATSPAMRAHPASPGAS